jgi:phosphoserine phosphatase
MDLQTEIKEKLSGKETPFAIFDFDNTCIINDIGEATFAYMCRNKLLKDTNLIGQYEGDYHEAVFKKYYALYGDGKIKEAYTLNSTMFSGLTPQEAGEVVSATIEAEGSEIGETKLYGITIARGLALRPQVIELMQFLKSNGVRVWVVSASTEIAVRVALEHFGIGGDLIGVKGVVTDGVITRELESPMPIIEGKVECMRKYIDQSQAPLLVIDDSTTGLPILETADIKVVVNRNNALTKEAQERGWYLV